MGYDSVAQLDRATLFEGVGSVFKSHLGHKIKRPRHRVS